MVVQNFYSKKSTLIGIAIILLLLLCAAYSNHFGNGFQFDDAHTIVNNAYIRDVSNLPLFFTDIKYFGINVGSQGYRPVLVSLNAIDYWIAGGLKSVYFHADIFLSYILLLALMFLFLKNIFNAAQKDERNKLIALLAVGFFALHASSAETINYIIQRADSFSTLLIIASLLLYINPLGRKCYLYIITIALAICTKETGVMIGPILFFYILFFEENTSLTELIAFKKIKNIFSALKKSLPAIIAALGILVFTRAYFVGSHAINTGDVPPAALNYYGTQAVIFAHYLANFILPLDLSASPDFEVFSSVVNRKVILALALVVALLIVAFKVSREKEKRPIAFGIVWFFLALVPTSAVPHAGELANDHRTFFPYIGLVISLAWWLRLMYLRYESMNRTNNLVTLLPALYFMIISLHAYGTYQRNIVWSSYEKLWHDALEKGPNSATAMMSYGVVLMEKSKYEEARPYFERTLMQFPNWAYINVNMGILMDKMGRSSDAEPYFKKAIKSQPYYPIGYSEYAHFLLIHGRMDEAIAQLEAGIKMSPGNVQISELLKNIRTKGIPTGVITIEKMKVLAEKDPTADNYVNLSLAYYKKAMYKECIEASEMALKLKPDYAMAYNNIGSSYNAMKQWVKGAEACRKALKIDPNLKLAKSNLAWAEKNIK